MFSLYFLTIIVIFSNSRRVVRQVNIAIVAVKSGHLSFCEAFRRIQLGWAFEETQEHRDFRWNMISGYEFDWLPSLDLFKEYT